MFSEISVSLFSPSDLLLSVMSEDEVFAAATKISRIPGRW